MTRRKEPGDIIDDATGLVRVLSEKCSTCIFRKGNLMYLREGQLEEIIRSNVESGSLLTCHKTLPYGDHPAFGPAACRGFWDGYADQTLAGIWAKHIIGTIEIEPPAKDNDE